MKYKILENNENHIKIFCLYDDNTFTLLDLVAGRELEEILQDAYISTKKKENRQAYSGEEIEGLKDYIPKPKVARLDVDFYNLTGKVFDQYGDILEAPISFEIEGTDKAKIEDGKLITEEVEEETSFFIVAKAGDFEERQERTLYPKVDREPVPPREDLLEAKIKATSDRQEFIEDLIAEMAMKVYE